MIMDNDIDGIDRDDVLDYMIYEDIEIEMKGEPCKSGCPGVLLCLLLPYVVSKYLF